MEKKGQKLCSSILKQAFHFTEGPAVLSCIMLSLIWPLTTELSSTNQGQLFQEDSAAPTAQQKR